MALRKKGLTKGWAKMDQDDSAEYAYPPTMECLACKSEFYEYTLNPLWLKVPFCRDCVGDTLEYHVWKATKKEEDDVRNDGRETENELGDSFGTFSYYVGKLDDIKCSYHVNEQGHGH